MRSDTFEKKVEKELKKLDRKQVVQFAWRCGVRALPFLGGRGSFGFWPEADRKKHLYALFYALDVAARAAYADAAARAAAARAAARAADAARAAAARAAARAAYAAADTARAAAFAASSAAADTYNIDLKPSILQDIKAIKEGEWGAANVSAEVWGEFQKALEAEGCAYWGQLYKQIFDDGFVLDKEALERRLNVPKEIRARGAASVANYLEQLEKGAQRLNEARILILGDKGAGKTCLARRLVDPQAIMTTDKESTAGVDTTLWKLEDENINVRIWDFAGHTVTHAVHQFFLSERCLYIMVYDGRTEERNRLEYWLDHMQNYGGNSRAIILVNKRDEHSVDINTNTLKEKYPIAGVHTFSIQDDEADLEAFRKEVAGFIENNPSWEKQEIPTSYYKVKDELESLFCKGEKEKCQEHITRKAFDEIAAKYEIEDIEKLLKDLHFLGVSLWYKNMEAFDTLVLNPEWISHGVYKIINWVHEEKKHSLTLNDFVTVFEEDAIRYPEDQHNFLFELMKHYELAYETDHEKRLIIPHLLKEDRPAMLPEFPVGESLMLRYKAEQPLPPNTISRFIVRHNQEIKYHFVWRYGVVLEDGKGSTALVREEDRTISVAVQGKDKTNYVDALRETLNAIFNTYKSDKPELQYRVERFGEIPDDVEEKHPLWLPDSKIYNHDKRGKPYYDDFTDQDIPMGRVVNLYKIEKGNLIFGWQGDQIGDDYSSHTTFNFYESNTTLQGRLNYLAQLLTKSGNEQEAKELKDVAKALEDVEKCESKEEVKKEGIVNWLQDLLSELSDDKSKLNKAVKGVKNGIGIAKEIAQGCNAIAQWVSLM